MLWKCSLLCCETMLVNTETLLSDLSAVMPRPADATFFPADLFAHAANLSTIKLTHTKPKEHSRR